MIKRCTYCQMDEPTIDYCPGNPGGHDIIDADEITEITMDELAKLRFENEGAQKALKTAIGSCISGMWLFGPEDNTIVLQMSFVRDMATIMHCKVESLEDSLLFGAGFTKHAIGLIMNDKVEWAKYQAMKDREEAAKKKTAPQEKDPDSESNPMSKLGYSRGD